MSKAQPLPRKYKTSIEEAQDTLCYIAKRAEKALELLQSERRTVEQAQFIVQEIKARAYEVAFNLSEIEVAPDCMTCPAAPPTTRYQTQLLVLADALERLAAETRQSVQPQRQTSSGTKRQRTTLEG